MPRYVVTETYGNRKRRIQKGFSAHRKKSKAKEQLYNSIPDALRDSHISNAKDLTIDLAMLFYGNRQNAKKFAQANNFDFLRALKHVMDH